MMHKQNKCQVTGEAAPLVLVVPVNPLHLRHFKSISNHSLPAGEEEHPNRFSPNTLWKLSEAAAGGVFQRCMPERPRKPLVEAMLGASDNKRHLRGT